MCNKTIEGGDADARSERKRSSGERHVVNDPGDGKSVSGVIYLIHFEEGLVVRTEPNGTVVYARHYIGWTSNHDQRMAEHNAGRGSSLMAAVNRAGISWRIVRMWEGTRNDERKIKRCRNAPRYCPICKEDRGDEARGLDDPGLPELQIGGSQMAKDAAGHDRLRVGLGWISINDDGSITVSDGDGYTLPQSIRPANEKERQLILEYIISEHNPRPEPMGREETREDGWTYISKIENTDVVDFRYRPMGVRVQAEVYVGGTESWESFGVFKDNDDMYGEIELSRAEPRPD